MENMGTPSATLLDRDVLNETSAAEDTPATEVKTFKEIFQKFTTGLCRMETPMKQDQLSYSWRLPKKVNILFNFAPSKNFIKTN